MRVLAAMSGGVDSAVAASRAVEAGHDVVGVHLALSEAPDTLRTGSRGCCSKEDAGDARRAADVLGIPFYVWDFAEQFKEDVIEDFVAAYAAGETPNPCLRCNEKIKFAALADRAVALGFDAVATGHYARLHDGVLRRAVDADKDQSYVLAVLTRGSAVAGACSRSATPRSRKSAPRPPTAGSPSRTSPTATTSASFRPVTPARSSAREIGVRPGSVVDADSGAVLASHDGVHGFTIGQRKGLGLPGPAADGRPRYVTAIEPDTGNGHASGLPRICRCRDRRRACDVDLGRRAGRPDRVRRAGARARRDRGRGRGGFRWRVARAVAGAVDRRRSRSGRRAVPARSGRRHRRRQRYHHRHASHRAPDEQRRSHRTGAPASAPGRAPMLARPPPPWSGRCRTSRISWNCPPAASART